MKSTKRLSLFLASEGFTLVELLVALVVTSVILTAVATLAYAMSRANDVTDDTGQKQAQVRYATLRISELIKHSKLVCAAPGNDLAFWRADDNNDGKINPTELVYLETGQAGDYLQILEFSGPTTWDLMLSEITDTNTKEALILACTAKRTLMVPQCSNIRFLGLDSVLPRSKVVVISFELLENDVIRQYQISGTLRGWAGYLLNETGDCLVSDDD